LLTFIRLSLNQKVLKAITNQNNYPFLQGGGEMGELTRQFDWSQTPVGTPGEWPQSLRTTVSNLLRSKFPMFLWWGEEMIQFYNDAYRPSMGSDGKHPTALGQKGKECWPEIWEIISPLLDQVKTTGEAVWLEDQLVPIYRNGKIEDVYWTFSYSSVLDDEGKHGGILVTCTETTEKVISEYKLKESERQLRNTIYQAPVAICIYRGKELVIEEANEKMFEFWGKSAEQVMHKPLFEAIPEAKNQGYEELLADVFKTGQSYAAKESTVTLPRKGIVQKVYINISFTPIHEPDGTISGIMAMAIDVTEQVLIRKRLEESEVALQKRVAERTADLQQQKVLIETVLAASLDGIYALKAVREPDGEIADFQYLFANDKVAKLVNREVNQMIGASMLTLIPENKTNGFFDLFCRILQTGETYRSETHFVFLGTNYWYDYVIVPIDKETVVVTVEDITEKKQVVNQIEEQRNLLDNILKNSSNGISVSQVFRDDTGTVVDAITILANDAAVKYIGLPRETYLSKRATEIEPHIIGSPYYQNCIKTLETGEPFFTQYQMESTGRWLELTVSKLDEDHLIHVFTDVTPIKEVQLQLEKYVEKLKRSNKNLEEFAYAASHDLKEPTRKIHVFADRLKSSLGERMTESEKLYFQRMELASKRMSTLIDDLLTYSEASQKTTLEETVDMNEVMNQVLSDLDLEIEQKRATIEVSQLFTITGHRRQLQQAFHNLIGNALKYSKPGVPPVITIECSIVNGSETGLHLVPDQQAKDFYKVMVKDNGIGFEQANAERIFNVFTRLHGMAEYKGTGVGLSIVRKVIENHNGYIWAESHPGEGTAFYVLLPVE
jgi:PAS domain S-box-containing protein